MVRFLLWASQSTKTTDQEAPCFPNRFSPFTASRAALAIPIELQKREQALSDPHRIMVEPPAHLHPTDLQQAPAELLLTNLRTGMRLHTKFQVMKYNVNPKYFCLHYLKGNIYTYRRWISDNCQQGTLIWAYPIHMFCPLHSLVGSHRLVKLKTLSLPQKIKMYIYQKVKQLFGFSQTIYTDIEVLIFQSSHKSNLLKSWCSDKN